MNKNKPHMIKSTFTLFQLRIIFLLIIFIINKNQVIKINNAKMMNQTIKSKTNINGNRLAMKDKNNKVMKAAQNLIIDLVNLLSSPSLEIFIIFIGIK